MTKAFASLIRAFQSLPNGKLLRILVLSMLLNAGVLFVLVAGISIALSQITLFDALDWLADIGGTFLAATIAYFIYPVLLPLIITFFDTIIAEAVEEKEYEDVPKAEPPFWPTIKQDIKFTLRALLYNVIALPLYLVPGLNLILYYLLNGYLLGNEFFNIIAGRHADQEEARRLRYENGWTIIFVGMMITFGSTIPFVNLVAPLIGVVMMVHYFHSLKPKYKVLLNQH